MSLTPSQLAQYRQDGFVIVEDFFSRDDLQPVMDDIERIVGELAERLYRHGKVSRTWSEEGLYTRLSRLEEEFAGAAVLVHIRGILEPGLAALWSNPRLLDAIEQILGPEVAGHPVWNLRSKTPANPLLTVPWHQDTAYLAAGAERTLQPTAWIPLLDARGENGTLQVIRGGHRSGQVFRHRPENRTGHPSSWYLTIPDSELPAGERVTCEMKLGSLLLINQLIPHRSTENYSDKIRWSVDLRWQRPGEPSGFEAIKPLIRMRSADPAFRFDWGEWASQNRIAEGMLDKQSRDPEDQFNTMVSGPWLERWR